VRDVFGYLIYDGQRRWAQVYLRGLMLPGLRRKSVQPMAAALGVPEQNLGHFAGVAGWDWHEVTARLAARDQDPLDDVVGSRRPPVSTFGKTHRVREEAVRGQRPPKLCQIGVSWHAVSPRGSAPLDWRLFVPEAWADDPVRRERARIPVTLAHRTKPALALEMLDELAGLGLRPPLALADSLYGQNVAFRQGLEDSHVPWLLAIPGQTTLISAAGPPAGERVGRGERQRQRLRPRPRHPLPGPPIPLPRARTRTPRPGPRRVPVECFMSV